MLHLLGHTSPHHRDLEERAKKLSASKCSLEGEVAKSKAAMDTLRSKLQAEHRAAVVALDSKCQEYEEKLGEFGRWMCCISEGEVVEALFHRNHC